MGSRNAGCVSSVPAIRTILMPYACRSRPQLGPTIQIGPLGTTVHNATPNELSPARPTRERTSPRCKWRPAVTVKVLMRTSCRGLPSPYFGILAGKRPNIRNSRPAGPKQETSRRFARATNSDLTPRTGRAGNDHTANSRHLRATFFRPMVVSSCRPRGTRYCYVHPQQDWCFRAPKMTLQ